MLLGAPGVGKGTQAKAIMAAWGVPQISTGDLLREMKNHAVTRSPLADRLLAEGKLHPEDMDRMAAGKLVSDTLVNDMVAVRLQEPDTARGYILDGFPRTLNQANWLDLQLGVPRQAEAEAKVQPLVAISIHVGYTELLRRITGRRSCPQCQRIYNIYLQPPVVDTVCDVDGTPLEQRADDVPEVFEERMRVYAEQTAPVVEHYRELRRSAEVDGEQPVAQVTQAIIAAVKQLRG